jgi:hypothetical protein
MVDGRKRESDVDTIIRLAGGGVKDAATLDRTGDFVGDMARRLASMRVKFELIKQTAERMKHDEG